MPEYFQTFGGFIVSVLALVIAVYWLVLPFIVLSKFRETIRKLSTIEEHLRMMRYNDEKARRESRTQKEIDDL